MTAKVTYANSQLNKAMMVAASGGIVMPPKLLPETTTPVMRPIEWGNHNPTIFPAGNTVAPGKPAYTSADNVYQCHNSVISGRNTNPTAININDTTITGRTPNRSVQYPITGANIPEINAKVNDRFNSV